MKHCKLTKTEERSLSGNLDVSTTLLPSYKSQLSNNNCEQKPNDQGFCFSAIKFSFKSHSVQSKWSFAKSISFRVFQTGILKTVT